MTHQATRRASRATLVACVAACSVQATALHAQPAAPTAARSFWFLALTGNGGWDSNPNFLPNGEGETFGSVLGSLTVFKRVQHGTIALTGNAGGTRFQKSDALNNASYGLALSADKRFTAAFTGSAQAGYDTRLSTGIGGPLNLPLLNQSIQKSVTASVSGVDRISARTTARVGAAYSGTRFDTPTLLPGDIVDLTANLARRYNAVASVVLDAKVQEGKVQGLSVSIQTLQAGWQSQYGTATIQLLAGATRATTAGTSTVAPAGSATVADSVWKGVLSAGYSYAQTPAFGLAGVLTTSAFSVGYDMKAPRGSLFNVQAVNAVSKQTVGNLEPFRATSASSSLRKVLKNGFTLAVTALYRARGGGGGDASGYGAQLGAGYTFGNR